MNHNHINAYDADLHVAEIYDQYEMELDDVSFLRKLIENSGPMKILEPFCGTGRILIPLALDGHILHGMDQSAGMLSSASWKIQQLPLEAPDRINLAQADVLCENEAWPGGFDLVILGCNCFYELATPDEQENCILRAFQSLKPGGHLFIDNNHMEGDLDVTWRNIGVVETSLSGKCLDGTIVENTRETIWFDVPRRLTRFRRRTKVVLPDGNVFEQEFIQQKHPVSQVEIQGWLEKHGFMIEGLHGNYSGVLYTNSSSRAIFWAKRT
jgi:SAM-dependent methyltransferase